MTDISELLFEESRAGRVTRTSVLSILRKHGLATVEQVEAATDEELLALGPVERWGCGIGRERLRKLREAVTAMGSRSDDCPHCGGTGKVPREKP